MSDETQPDTQISEPVVAPTVTPEPTEPTPVPPSTSEQVEVPPVAPESPREVESAVPVNNDIEQIEPTEAVPEQTSKDSEAAYGAGGQEQVVPPTQTAQILVNEPFAKLTLLAKAREMIQFRKRKKLEKIMGMFLKQRTVANDEVEKLLHVSDATATRYLSQLEKEGKIKQEGRTGKSVSYSRI